jgi:uncharacterized protein (TIGR00645 family)
MSSRPEEPARTAGASAQTRSASWLNAVSSLLGSTLFATRILLALPVVILVLAAMGAFVYGLVVFIYGLVDVVQHPYPVGNRIGLFLLVVDMFLVGATLFIAAVGLYELFLRRGDDESAAHMPNWLRMRDLTDLEARVIVMIVLVVSVTFVEIVVDQPAGLEVLGLGAGIALVIGALTLFVRFGERSAR